MKTTSFALRKKEYSTYSPPPSSWPTISSYYFDYFEHLFFSFDHEKKLFLSMSRCLAKRKK